VLSFLATSALASRNCSLTVVLVASSRTNTLKFPLESGARKSTWPALRVLCAQPVGVSTFPMYPAGIDRTAGPVQPQRRIGQISKAYFVFMMCSSLGLIRMPCFERLLVLVGVCPIDSASWRLIDDERENQGCREGRNYCGDAD